MTEWIGGLTTSKTEASVGVDWKMNAQSKAKARTPAKVRPKERESTDFWCESGKGEECGDVGGREEERRVAEDQVQVAAVAGTKVWKRLAQPATKEVAAVAEQPEQPEPCVERARGLVRCGACE